MRDHGTRAPLRLIGAALLLLLAAGCNQGFENSQTGTRLGLVRLYQPKASRNALVFLFSDVSGWNEALHQAALGLVARGAVVVGVPLPPYRQRLAASADGCHYLISEIEYISKKVQQDLHFESYHWPVLVGVGQGATLAYAALAQSPAATVAGAISIDPAQTLMTRVPLCTGAPWHAVESGGYRYDAYAKLPGRFVVSTREGDADAWEHLAADCGAVATFAAPEGDLEARIGALAEPMLPQSGSAAAGSVDQLPLVEYPVTGEPDTVLIFFSGDGGWRDLDKQIGEIVVRQGIPVIGIDSLRYFWRPKTPGEISADLAALFRAYAQRWKVKHIALAGYSFGADILPFAYNRLPDDVRDVVVQMSLLGVESTAMFEFKLEGWLFDVAGQQVLPELRQVPGRIVQCFYGEEEGDTLCRSPDLPGIETIRTSGSHHFDGDYGALAEWILDGLERRTGVKPSARDHAS